MANIMVEHEGLTKARLKTLMRKIDHCDFNTIISHFQVQMIMDDREYTSDEMQEVNTDLQPVQVNTIYIKCAVMESLKDFTGTKDSSKDLLAKRRNTAPIMKKLGERTSSRPFTHTLPTESPIEDEFESFPITGVEKDIIFYNPQKIEIGWYNRKANILWICDVAHNPHRIEMLFDRVMSAVYEYQTCNSLNVISPLYEDFAKQLEKRGYSKAALWWTGFEDKQDTAYIDGQLDAAKFLEEESGNLINAGSDIFFLRNLMTKGSCSISVEKCKGKVELEQYKEVPIPAHTTLEEEIKAIENYVSDYTKRMAKEFYTLASKAMEEKRVK